MDNSNLQSKLKNSPQIIGYVIENNDINITKYYDTFFEASRANYRWKFAMPTYQKNFLDSDIVESSIIPSLISWESEKPIHKMKKNQFELISFQIQLSKSKKHFNTFLNTFGKIENVSVLTTNQEPCSIFKLELKDNLRNIIISF